MAQKQVRGSEEPLAYQVEPFLRLIGISRGTFYKLVNADKIRIVRIGGRTLVPATEVRRLLCEGATIDGSKADKVEGNAGLVGAEAGA